MLINLTLRHLEVLLAIAEQGSLRGAAERLFLSQPAVTQQLQALEREVGFALVDRRSRGSNLTAEGSQMLEYVRSALGAVRDLERLVDDIAAGRTGQISLGATLTAAEWLVPRLVAAFRNAAPDIEMGVKVLDPSRVALAFADHAIHVAILQDPGDDLESIPLRRHTLVAVAGPAGPAGPAEEWRRTLLLREPGSETRAAVEGWLTEGKVVFDGTMEFASNTALREAAAAGLGLAVLSTDAVGFEIASQAVRLIDLPGLPLHRHWRLAFPANRVLSPAVHRLLAFCQSPAGESAIYS